MMMVRVKIIDSREVPCTCQFRPVLHRLPLDIFRHVARATPAYRREAALINVVLWTSLW
jgi:hypothetical protein